MLLERNEYYWGRTQVELDRIIVRFYDDPQEITRQFLQGEIHWANSWANAPELRPYVVANPLFATTYFYFRSDREPFDDERVRNGLALLLPWHEIRNPEAAYFPSDTLVPDIADYPEVIGIREQDVRRGLQLLGKAGYAGGRGLPTINIKVAAGSVAVRVAQIMQEAWEAQLGVEVAVQEFAYRDLIEEIRPATSPSRTRPGVGDFADPLTFPADVDALKQPERRRLLQSPVRPRGDARAAYRRNRTPAGAGECRGDAARGGGDSADQPHGGVQSGQPGQLDGWYPNALDIHPFRFIRFRRLEGPPRRRHCTTACASVNQLASAASLRRLGGPARRRHCTTARASVNQLASAADQLAAAPLSRRRRRWAPWVAAARPRIAPGRRGRRARNNTPVPNSSSANSHHDAGEQPALLGRRIAHHHAADDAGQPADRGNHQEQAQAHARQAGHVAQHVLGYAGDEEEQEEGNGGARRRRHPLQPVELFAAQDGAQELDAQEPRRHKCDGGTERAAGHGQRQAARDAEQIPAGDLRHLAGNDEHDDLQRLHGHEHQRRRNAESAHPLAQLLRAGGDGPDLFPVQQDDRQHRREQQWVGGEGGHAVCGAGWGATVGRHRSTSIKACGRFVCNLVTVSLYSPLMLTLHALGSSPGRTAGHTGATAPRTAPVRAAAAAEPKPAADGTAVTEAAPAAAPRKSAGARSKAPTAPASAGAAKTTKTSKSTRTTRTTKTAGAAKSASTSKANGATAASTTATAKSKKKSTTTVRRPRLQYKVGQQLVYPLQGVGQVTTIEERPFRAVTLLYYVVYLAVSDMTIMVPVEKADELGIRAIVPRTEANGALRLIGEDYEPIPTDWKLRYQMNLDLLKAGAVSDIATVVRALYHRSRIKELPILERKLYDNARSLLVDELSFSLGKDKGTIEEMINSRLQTGAKA